MRTCVCVCAHCLCVYIYSQLFGAFKISRESIRDHTYYFLWIHVPNYFFPLPGCSLVNESFLKLNQVKSLFSCEPEKKERMTVREWVLAIVLLLLLHISILIVAPLSILLFISPDRFHYAKQFSMFLWKKKLFQIIMSFTINHKFRFKSNLLFYS